MKPNRNFQNLQDSYLFYEIRLRAEAYQAAHPEKRLYALGIGDVTQPLIPAVISAMHKAVDEQAKAETFHGYLPECGTDFLRAAIRDHYSRLGVRLTAEECFVTSGAGDELGNLLALFGPDNRVLISEPAYPAYADTGIIAGQHVQFLPAMPGNNFLPLPTPGLEGDILYLCSPNNPTGAAYTRAELRQWVDWANRVGAVIVFDAAYEAFVADPEIPHSIFEIPGAEACAIEIASLSKTAGFTGTRCGYTVVPRALVRDGLHLHEMWVRARTTMSNGVSYILQRGAEAALSAEGRAACLTQIAVYRNNAAVLRAACREAGLQFWGGENAPYVWLKCPGNLSGWDFFDHLLNAYQVLGTPGEGFGPHGKGFLRLSAFGKPETVAEAAARLRAGTSACESC